MTARIRKVGVIGAGTMGRAIAAHLANVGIPSVLLDIVPRELTDKEAAKGLTLQSPAVRDRIATDGLKLALKDKPAAFYTKDMASLVQTGNSEDHLGKLADCDWIVEAAIERLDIKRTIFKRVAEVRKLGSIVSTNTSGIRLADIVAGDELDDDFKANFLVTHFFNPVRYMRLLEIVPGQATDPDTVAAFADFSTRRLGKGVVMAKDTPNFIANRIGVFGMMAAVRAMGDMGLDVTTIDAIVGSPMGRPKSGAFRLADMVGLDVLMHVAHNVYEGCPDDEVRDFFQPPDFLTQMVERRWLGSKTGQGFYKKVKTDAGKDIHQLDLNTLEYVARPKVRFPSTGKARNIDDPGARLKMMVNADDQAGELAWRLTAESLLYTARRIPEIADDIVAIDDAMRWGFAWDLGPFQAWDAIGLTESIARMEKEGREIPELATKARDAGGFYQLAEGHSTWFDLGSGERKPLVQPAGHIVLANLKDGGAVVDKNLSATMLDLGDGCLGLEFHSKMNAIDGDIIEMMHKAVDRAEKEFEALVVANDAANFSAGANVMLVLMASQAKQWDQIESMVDQLQKAAQRMRYSAIPVVTAPAGMTLGGGAEVAMGGDRIRAHAELYMGQVEIGVGLIPAGGGCKELLRRVVGAVPTDVRIDSFPLVRKVFEIIGMAKVATSADEARQFGFLTEADQISTARGRLTHDAKQDALGMAAAGYRPSSPVQLRLPGAGAKAALSVGLSEWARTGTITEYEAKIGGKLAHVLTGGDTADGKPVSEQYILDLEREAFLSLCGEAKTQERIQHFLMKGKPLRN